MTTLINLWGGPGSGKSTTAAGVFCELKQQGVSCELITEYVKSWAWRGVEIGPFDDVYITAKQLRRESACYGRVDYVVTDSPIGLGAVFESIYKPGTRTMHHLCTNLRARQLAAGIRIMDLVVQRTKPYVQAGRWEDEAKARQVDAACAEYLAPWGFGVVRGVDEVVARLPLGSKLP
jgi:hypothetical protein